MQFSQRVHPKIICENSGVNIKIKIGEESLYDNGYKYTPFIVELTFKNMIIYKPDNNKV